MYKLELYIPQVPPSLNRTLRMHYHKRNHAYKEWYTLLGYKIKDKPKEPLERFKITIVRHFFRQLDYDGLVASYKPVVDSLKHCNVILDDRYCCSGPWDITQKFRPKVKKALTYLKVEEVCNAE